ncbi:hypothetical protein PTTG_07335 [Puccinia triticina 1-1 BBBD Race 1]|uniref:Uncharacterized protein n=1 Tax=Puccinia triticina (isolate 1-1 / race 1 (BBBD)) TaxID=630390 RepID=A0A180GDA6_PUCT1|nr:hypothetical protein PTTG_07335 [Puccinia triticina 1-1 BBBD Race 1]
MNPSPEVLTSPQGRNVTSDRDIVQRRYEELHPLDQDAQNSVARLLNATSLSQVNQYLDELTKAFEQVTPQMPIEACTWMWNLSLSAPIVSRDWHQSAWKIDHELNVKFLRLVFFHRYPKLAAAEPPISTPEMLEALAAPSHEAGEKLLKPAPANPTDVQHVQTLKDGYNHPYLRNDQIVKPILECLSEYAKNWKPEKYLAPYTALIGPSMSGKTRFLMQLSENICVIYICLRPHKSTGIPPRSVLADEFQLEMNAPEILVHYYRLLAALFDVVSDFFSTRTSDHNEKQLLLEWSDYNHQHGGKLATQVRRAMEKIGEEGPAASAAFKENLRKLATSTSFISNPGLKILLGIDEARALVEQGSGDAQNLSYFRALCRVLSKVPTQLNFFAIFTDTTSKVANFLPALQNDPSARPLPDSEEDSKELYAPIYDIATFDLKVSSSPPETWDELLSPRRLFSYGTPFFRIYVETVEKPPRSLKPDVIAENVRKMAIGKLLCFPCSSDALSKGQIFALLGCTIQPQIFEASRLNSELVSSHMAHCLYISDTRERLISEYPSQYTLSMAANYFLAEDDSRLISCIKALTSFMQQGLISSGNSGELVSRIILLRAMQKAMLTSPIRTKQPNITYGCSVRLADFLKALTGKEEPTGEEKTAEKSKPPRKSTRKSTGKSTSKPEQAGKDESTGAEESVFQLNMENVHQARLLKEGRIFWNHFVQITYTPQPADFLNFLYRGLAVQCKPDQRGFDQMFTVYLAPEDAESTLTKDHISFCGVQAKNGSFKFPEEGPKWNSNYAEVELNCKIPYLIILFSFKTKSTTYELPTIPQRGSLIFHGLDNIACLTPKISIALQELLSVDPDVRQFHKDNKRIRRFVETTRPCIYNCDHQEVDLFHADKGVAIDQAPNNPTL